MLYNWINADNCPITSYSISKRTLIGPFFLTKILDYVIINVHRRWLNEIILAKTAEKNAFELDKPGFVIYTSVTNKIKENFY